MASNVYLPSGGAIPGIPGDYAPGVYLVDYDARTAIYISNPSIGFVSSPLTRTATSIFVAASNASLKSKLSADYVCGGDNDDIEIQAALDAVAVYRGEAKLSEGTFTTVASILQPNHTRLSGMGVQATTIQVRSGTGLTTPILCGKDWYNNGTTCGSPIEAQDFLIDGNSSTSGSNAHGMCYMNYWSRFSNISINDVTGNGFVFTAHNRAGTHISNTCVEPRIYDLQVRNCGGIGIYVQDDSNPFASCTDGFLFHPIVQNTGTDGIKIDTGAGWQVAKPHAYGCGTNGVVVLGGYGTCITDAYVDFFGIDIAATYITGIRLWCLNGRGSSIIGAKVGFETGAATGPYTGISIVGNGAGVTTAHIDDCQIQGGSQSGSLGYSFQTQPTQRSYDYFVYRTNLNSQNVATHMYEDTYTKGGKLYFGGHIGCDDQNRPTGAAGSASGGTPPSPVLSNCTDTAGRITFGTGTSPTAGEMVALTFHTAYVNYPSVVVTPLNAATAALNLYVTRTSTVASICCANAPAASQANTTYAFCYQIMEI